MKQKLKYYPKPKGRTFQIDHVHVKWDQQVPLHQQETWELSYIVTGGGIRTIGEKTETFSKGEIILIPPNIPHCWSFDEAVHDDEGKIENITMIFDHDFIVNSKDFFPELFNRISEFLNIQDAVFFKDDTVKRLQMMMTSIANQDEAGRITSFIEILQLISNSKEVQVVGMPVIENPKERKFQEIYLFVLSNFQRNITLEEVSKLAGMQKSSFCVFFKKMTGKSFFSYLTEFRIESSCQMLLKTKLSVAEICIASGFSDIPYYNRVFKKMKMVSPTRFRKDNASAESSSDGF